MPTESPARAPSWHNKPVPAGLVVVLVTMLLGAGGFQVVKAASPAADLTAVDTRIEASANQLRREVHVGDVASEALASARYDEILRRLDRIERRMDDKP